MHMLAHHKLPSFCSHEPAETGRHLAKFLATTRVVPESGFARAARVSGVQIGAFSIVVIALGTSVSLEAMADDDYSVMVLCLRGSGEMVVNGRVIPIRTDEGCLLHPRGILRARFSSDCVRLVVRIESRLINSGHLAYAAKFQLKAPALLPWFEYIQFLLCSRAMMAAIASDEVVRESVETLLATLLQRTCLPAIEREHQRLSASRDVRNAEAFIRANLSHDVRLAEIATAAGVSVRTLQSNFKSHREASPMQYLRNLRLDMAREQISAGSTVANAAFDCGFLHQGRFAQYYRDRFGHLPSRAFKAIRLDS
jgi:AraC-like DNA-binding protein